MLLVPIASSVVLAGMVSAASNVFERFRRMDRVGGHARFIGSWIARRCWRGLQNAQPVKAIPASYLAALVIALPIAYSGVSNLAATLASPRVGASAVTKFVHDIYRAGYLFMIPPELEWFRLAAKVPILVDFKSHPYKDVEVVEWFDRLSAAQEFYALSGSAACGSLERIVSKYGVTHVISKSQLDGCKLIQQLHQDASFIVYEVMRPPRLGAYEAKPCFWNRGANDLQVVRFNHRQSNCLSAGSAPAPFSAE